MSKVFNSSFRNAFVSISTGIALGAAFLVFAAPNIAMQPAARVSTQETLLEDFVANCVSIKPGSEGFSEQFQMGGNFEGPFALAVNTVTIKQPFRISKFETTQELYSAVTGANPSRWKGPKNSVESMNWLQADAFCEKLTSMLRAKELIAMNEVVRLPTEAEWEYCCRAGSQSRYSFGDMARTATDQEPLATVLNDYAWHTGNAAGNDPAVGVLKPNSWGLFDMHGYLWEFVSDEYAPGAAKETASPQAGATVRVMRGGSWRDHYSSLTSGARMPVPDHTASDAIGFRCVIASE